MRTPITLIFSHMFFLRQTCLLVIDNWLQRYWYPQHAILAILHLICKFISCSFKIVCTFCHVPHVEITIPWPERIYYRVILDAVIASGISTTSKHHLWYPFICQSSLSLTILSNSSSASSSNGSGSASNAISSIATTGSLSFFLHIWHTSHFKFAST